MGRNPHLLATVCQPGSPPPDLHGVFNQSDREVEWTFLQVLMAMCGISMDHTWRNYRQ